MNVQKNEPKLRFAKGELNQVYFDSLVQIKIGLTHTPKYLPSGRPFLSSKNISKDFIDFEDIKYMSEEEFDSLPKGARPQVGDILFTRVGSNLGNPIVLEDERAFGIFVSLGAITVNSGHDNYYIKYWMETPYFWKQVEQKVAGGAKNNINTSWLKEFKLVIPNFSEQREIADFLSAVDKKISLLKEKHALLEQYKKGVMQKLFSQETRFKDEKGNEFSDWIKGTLGDLSNKVSNKNQDESVTAVLTNSAKSGIVNQTDYFKKDIANENNLGGYSIVEKNDFVYNPRISVLAPVGPIKRNHVGQGVMSPLYTIFRFKNEDILDYLELYFETAEWHRYMNSIANIGARHDRMNITTGDFFNLPIPIPSEYEMGKIVGFIQSLNKKVDLVAQQLKQTQTFKKGLLQQMFV